MKGGSTRSRGRARPPRSSSSWARPRARRVSGDRDVPPRRDPVHPAADEGRGGGPCASREACEDPAPEAEREASPGEAREDRPVERVRGDQSGGTDPATPSGGRADLGTPEGDRGTRGNPRADGRPGGPGGDRPSRADPRTAHGGPVPVLLAEGRRERGQARRVLPLGAGGRPPEARAWVRRC